GPLPGLVRVRARLAEQAQGPLQRGQGLVVRPREGVDPPVLEGQSGVQGAALRLVAGGAGLVGDAPGVGEVAAGARESVRALLLRLEPGEFAQGAAEVLVARVAGVGGERLVHRLAGAVELTGFAEEYGRLRGDHRVAARVVVPAGRLGREGDELRRGGLEVAARVQGAGAGQTELGDEAVVQLT